MWIRRSTVYSVSAVHGAASRLFRRTGLNWSLGSFVFIGPTYPTFPFVLRVFLDFHLIDSGFHCVMSGPFLWLRVLWTDYKSTHSFLLILCVDFFRINNHLVEILLASGSFFQIHKTFDKGTWHQWEALHRSEESFAPNFWSVDLHFGKKSASQYEYLELWSRPATYQSHILHYAIRSQLKKFGAIKLIDTNSHGILMRWGNTLLGIESHKTAESVFPSPYEKTSCPLSRMTFSQTLASSSLSTVPVYTRCYFTIQHWSFVNWERHLHRLRTTETSVLMSNRYKKSPWRQRKTLATNPQILATIVTWILLEVVSEDIDHGVRA